MTTAALLVAALLSLQFAQFAPQATPPPATASISGRLTSVDQGVPVRKAEVRLTSASPRIARTTTTDAEGRFIFTDLPAAEYTLSASRPGFLEMVHGARQPGASAQGTLVTLAAGQRRENVSWTLPRAGVITGTVLDEFGDPAFNVPVRVMRYVFTNGFRSLTSGGNGVTDDRGQYRVAGLPPGEYLVAAVPRDAVADATLRAEAIRDRWSQAVAAAKAKGVPPNVVATPPALPSPVGYVPVYFPGTPLGSGAAAVRVGISEEVAGIDVKLQVMRTASISGRITSTEGALPTSRVQLLDASMPLSLVGVWFRDMRADGSFTFPGVVPGTYIVKAFGTPGGPKGAAGGEMWGSVTVSIDERGAEDVTLLMQRGVTVSGRVAVEDLPAGVDRARVAVRLLPVSSPTDWEMGSVALSLGTTGAFSATNVLPGTYRIAATGLPDGWTVATAPFGDRDAADHHLVVDGSRNLTGLVRFTASSATLTGRVAAVDDSPAPHHSVIVFPADSSQWIPHSRRIHLAQPGADGRFTLRGLPAGDYRVAAVLDPEPGRHFDASYLALLASTAETVTLAAGQAHSIDLRAR
jgi:hypothetical protein